MLKILIKIQLFAAILCPKLSIKLVVGIVMNVTLVKQSAAWLHDQKSEHFKALLSNNINNTSALADHVFSTLKKWDYLEILATGRSDLYCTYHKRNSFYS